jgi:hypothetical protein
MFDLDVGFYRGGNALHQLHSEVVCIIQSGTAKLL